MKKKKDLLLWMPWYIGDYLRDTTHLSVAEHGAYLLMMATAWQTHGLLPLKDDQLRRIARMTPDEWEASRDTLIAFWTLTDYGYMQPRLSEELEQAKSLMKQKSAAGKEGAKARWENGDGKDARIPKLVTNG